MEVVRKEVDQRHVLSILSYFLSLQTFFSVIIPSVFVNQGLWNMGFPCSSVGKDSACNAGDLGSIPGLGKSPGEEKWQPTPIFLPGKSQGQRSLVGSSLWSSPTNIGSCCCCCFSRFTHVRVSALPLWTAAGQAPLSMEFSRQ